MKPIFTSFFLITTFYLLPVIASSNPMLKLKAEDLPKDISTKELPAGTLFEFIFIEDKENELVKLNINPTFNIDPIIKGAINKGKVEINNQSRCESIPKNINIKSSTDNNGSLIINTTLDHETFVCVNTNIPCSKLVQIDKELAFGIKIKVPELRFYDCGSNVSKTFVDRRSVSAKAIISSTLTKNNKVEFDFDTNVDIRNSNSPLGKLAVDIIDKFAFMSVSSLIDFKVSEAKKMIEDILSENIPEELSRTSDKINNSSLDREEEYKDTEIIKRLDLKLKKSYFQIYAEKHYFKIILESSKSIRKNTACRIYNDLKSKAWQVTGILDGC